MLKIFIVRKFNAYHKLCSKINLHSLIPRENSIHPSITLDEITAKVRETENVSDDDVTTTAIDLILDKGFIKQDLDSYSDSPIPSGALKNSSSSSKKSIRTTTTRRTTVRRMTTSTPRKSIKTVAIDTGLDDLDKETAKLKASMEAAKSGGTEVDDKFTATVNRLTNRITILQNDHDNGEIDDSEFVDRMTKIEKEVFAKLYSI